MESKEIRRRFLDFFAQHGHKIVPSSSLIPTDPSVLLTTAGMQQFKPYYTGAADPIEDFGSKNTVSIQKSFRTSDIDEVGDDSHLTFFEMLGNFSFGGYGKEEAIKYAHEFITQELDLKISYVTVFGGEAGLPDSKAGVKPDIDSKNIWQSIGVTDIKEEGMLDVFWGPTGLSGPCGPTTEIYCKNARGQAVEIWNIVFNQFFFPGTREELLSSADGKQLEPLSTLGVDTGMGLERLAMITENKTNIFETDLFAPIVSSIPTRIVDERARRIIADHLRAISFLISDEVMPSNKGAGYVLRRLLRRVMAYDCEVMTLIGALADNYQTFYPELDKQKILKVFDEEKTKYSEALRTGLRAMEKLSKIDPPTAFKLYESYGLPFEVIKDRNPNLLRADFEKEFERHQKVSRAGAAGKFTGGLADHDPKTIKLHTAHHLLLAALQKVLGAEVKQRGSNINQERLRLDFSFDRKLTDDDKKTVEELVNQKITEDLAVTKKEMNKTEAEKLGAEMEFGAKYGEIVSVYFIAANPSVNSSRPFSVEFCGGPHVSRTGELDKFRILKDEPVAQGIRRIKAVLE